MGSQHKYTGDNKKIVKEVIRILGVGWKTENEYIRTNEKYITFTGNWKYEIKCGSGIKKATMDWLYVDNG